MTLPARVTASAIGLMFFLAAAAQAGAADQKAIVDQIKAHNQAATAAYSASDFQKMKSELDEAVTLANDNSLTSHAALAQTYVLLGVVEVEGLKHRDAGIGYFVKALQISPAASVPTAMAKKAVKAAFAKAEDQDATAPTTVATESKDKEKEKPAQAEKSEKAEKTEKTDKAEKEKSAQAEKAEKAEQAKQEKADKQAQAQAEKAEKENKAQAEKAEKAAEKAEKAEQARKSKELASAKEVESKAVAAREKLEKEKQDTDKQLTDAKARITQLQKEKADSEKELAAARASEKKEREAKEKLEKAKADTDKQLAEMKGRLDQLEKDNADKNKQLAIMRDGEKKERDAKEKLEKVWQEADAREKERKARETKETMEREKLAEGPDLPSRIPEPIHCTIPDEAAAGQDLYVHCVAQPSVGAKLISLYFRPAGVVPYNALLMEPNKKGWSVAIIPGKKITGKFLHYYVEARDARQEVTVSNGKASSPNVLTIRPAGSLVASQPSSTSSGSMKQAGATESRKKRTKAR